MKYIITNRTRVPLRVLGQLIDQFELNRPNENNFIYTIEDKQIRMAIRHNHGGSLSILFKYVDEGE